MLRLLKVAVACSLLSTTLCWGQAGRGTISGNVTDPVHATVPGASVKVTDPATGFQQVTTTGPDGNYSVSSLPVGTYTVTVEKTGFNTEVTDHVVVEVASSSRIDVSLRVGQVQERVEVTGQTQAVVTERSDLGTTLNTQQILDLPLSLAGGLRDNLSFTILTPGTTFNPGNDNSLRIGGGLSAGQSMQLDGAEAMSERRNDSSFQAVSTDAIAEFRVISNAFSAEYGRLGNGVIDFVTKSGTNQLHGALFEYFRNTDLNARQFFSASRAVVQQNNFGGSAGGPVFIPKLYDGRNKAFFYFTYEKAIYKQGSPSGTSSVPSNLLRNGDFSQYTDAAGRVIPIYDPNTTRLVGSNTVRDPFPNNVIPANRISPISQTVQNYIPQATLPGNSNNIQTVGNPGANQYVWSVKGDYNITPNSRLSGLISRQFFGSPDQLGPVPGPLGNNFNSSGTNKFYRLSHDQVITPTVLNHVTFGWNNRNVIEYFSQRYNSIPAADRNIIALKGAYNQSPTSNIVAPPEYNIGDQFGYYGFWINTLSPSRSAEVNEQLSWAKGKHNLKFGFEFLRADYARIDCNGCTGQANFSDNTTGLPGSALTTGASYASFLLGQASGGNYNTPGNFSFGESYYALFVQDDWKVNQKLTINAGLRYELPYSKTEAQSRVSNLCLVCPNPAAGNIPGALQFAGNGPGRLGVSSFLGTRYDAWGPRLGLAYQPVPGVVIRAGGGAFYLPEREGGNADQAVTGFKATVVSSSPDNGYTPAFALANGLPAAPTLPDLDPGQQLFGVVPFSAKYAGYAPKMYDWNFTLEKGFGQTTVARLSYTGTMGVSLLANREILTQVDPRYASLGSLLLAPISSPAAQAAGIQRPWATFPDTQSVAQALRPFPQYTGFQHSVDADTTGHSTYHAVSVSAEHRYHNGLWFQASYTWSKQISNVEGENPGLGGFVGNGDVGTQNAYDRRADKAVSVQDVPHHVVLAYSYDLPVGKGRRFLANSNAVTQAVLGGWRISAIQNYQSGYPITITSNAQTNLFSGTERANIASGVPLVNTAYAGDPNATSYVNLSAFSRPAPFTFGNSPKEISGLRTPRSLSEDVTLSKDFPLFREGQKLSASASAFNIGNRPIFGGLNTNVDQSGFGRLTSQSNRAREVQINLRLVF